MSPWRKSFGILLVPSDKNSCKQVKAIKRDALPFFALRGACHTIDHNWPSKVGKRTPEQHMIHRHSCVSFCMHFQQPALDTWLVQFLKILNSHCCLTLSMGLTNPRSFLNVPKTGIMRNFARQCESPDLAEKSVYAHVHAITYCNSPELHHSPGKETEPDLQ